MYPLSVDHQLSCQVEETAGGVTGEEATTGVGEEEEAGGTAAAGLTAAVSALLHTQFFLHLNSRPPFRIPYIQI